MCTTDAALVPGPVLVGSTGEHVQEKSTGRGQGSGGGTTPRAQRQQAQGHRGGDRLREGRGGAELAPAHRTLEFWCSIGLDQVQSLTSQEGPPSGCHHRSRLIGNTHSAHKNPARLVASSQGSLWDPRAACAELPQGPACRASPGSRGKHQSGGPLTSPRGLSCHRTCWPCLGSSLPGVDLKLLLCISILPNTGATPSGPLPESRQATFSPFSRFPPDPNSRSASHRGPLHGVYLRPSVLLHIPRSQGHVTAPLLHCTGLSPPTPLLQGRAAAWKAGWDGQVQATCGLSDLKVLDLSVPASSSVKCTIREASLQSAVSAQGRNVCTAPFGC